MVEDQKRQVFALNSRMVMPVIRGMVIQRCPEHLAFVHRSLSNAHFEFQKRKFHYYQGHNMLLFLIILDEGKKKKAAGLVRPLFPLLVSL